MTNVTIVRRQQHRCIVRACRSGIVTATGAGRGRLHRTVTERANDHAPLRLRSCAVANDPRLSLALLGPPVSRSTGAPLARGHAEGDRAARVPRGRRRSDAAGHGRRAALAGRRPDRARATLRRTLSTLRSALGGRWLVSDRDTMALADGEVVVDVHELRALLAACGAHGHLVTETCRRCREPLRAGGGARPWPVPRGVRPSRLVQFDDWQQRVDDDVLRREVAVALDRLADVVSAAGEHAAGDRPRRAAARSRPAPRARAPAADRAVRREPAIARRRSSSTASASATLDRELGVRPLEETTALYHAVLEGNALAAARRRRRRFSSPSTEPYPFVGRERELAALREAPRTTCAPTVGSSSSRARRGSARRGSREELAEHVGSRSALGHGRAASPRNPTLPYGVAIQLVRATLARVAEDDTVRGRTGGEPRSRGSRPSSGRRLSRRSTASRARGAVLRGGLRAAHTRRRAARHPWVLAIDDVALGRRGLAVGCSLYLAAPASRAAAPARRHVAARGDPGRRIRSAQLLAGGRRGRLAQPVPLGRLTARRRARARHVDAGTTPALAARLHRESGGLPFFVVEYLDALDRGDEDEAGDWPVPGGVRELLHARLDGLGELAGQVVAAAAVVGGSIPVDVVRDASGRGDDETVSALEQLVDAGVLVESGEQSSTSGTSRRASSS